MPDLLNFFFLFFKRGSSVALEQDPGHPFGQMLRSGKRTIPGCVLDCSVLRQKAIVMSDSLAHPSSLVHVYFREHSG